MVSFEVQLFAGALFIYLFDATLLLYGNELIFAVQGKRWYFKTGSAIQILRKNPYLPNPLQPGIPLFRVAWSATKHLQAIEPVALPEFLVALQPLQWLVSLLGLLLFCGLGWVALGHTVILFPLVVAVYGTILLLLWQLYRARRYLGLHNKFVAKLVFDALVCPPLALNIVRKITLGHSIPGDPVCFAQMKFSAESFQDLIAALCRVQDAWLQCMAEDNPKYAEVKAYQKSLKEFLQ